MNMAMRTDPATEHAVVVSLRLGEGDSRAIHERIAALTSRLEAVLAQIPGGEFGGLDLRGGFCLLYCYGNDAEEVYNAIAAPLAAYTPEPGSWAIKRFGGATDLRALRERVDLTPDDRG